MNTYVSIHELMKILWYIYNKYYSAPPKKEILPFVTLMDFEDIMLSEINQKEKYSMISFICGI